MKNCEVKEKWKRVSTGWNEEYKKKGIMDRVSPQQSGGFEEKRYVVKKYGKENKK